MNATRFSWPLLLLLCLAGCTGTTVADGMPRGAAAYQALDGISIPGRVEDYRIGALDTIDVAVFQEPELSVKSIAVDASGNVGLPLIGSVPAAGRTATELGREIARRLGEKYLEDPQVSVTVAASVSQKVAVQGEVVQPGVYEIKGPTTLLEALAMAKGETRVAALKQVVVFRTVDGRRLGGVFDVEGIRRGDVPDPQLLGNDVVVVGYSGARGLWRDVISAVPLLNIFRPIG